MKLTVELILGSVIALMLGLAVASPILMANLALTTKIQIEVDVVYAYFGIQEFNSNVTGLWRNSSDSLESNLPIVTYLIILNVTNRSDRLALIGMFEVSGAQEILVQNGTERIGSEKLAKSITVSPISDKGFGVAKENTIVTDLRDLSRFYPGWSQYWSPNESRLIGLTGMVEVSNTAAYAALQSGTIYLYGEAEGLPYGGGSQSRGFSLKHVQLQMIGKDFLYNSVLSENQMLRIDSNGIDVYIETRR